MVFNTWRIERIPRLTDSSWDTANPIVITNFYDPLLRVSLGSGKDSFTFKQTNFNGELDDYWQVGDKIIVYYKVNSSTIDSSDVLLNGVVQDVPSYDTYNRSEVEVKCTNFSEVVMEAITFFDPGASGVDVDTYLENAVEKVALLNPNFRITWSDENPSLKKDGVTAFPTRYEKWFYKNLLTLLEKYSQDTVTGDGNYYWYVNVDNELVWRPKLDSVDFDFDTGTDAYKSLTIKKDLNGIVNFVIAKGGLSPQGKSITVRADNAASRSKHGFKYYLLVSEANTAQQLMDLDKASSGFTGDGNDPTTYPFTTAWVSEETGSAYTVSDYDDYDAKVRQEIKYRLKNEANLYIQERKNGKLVIEVEFENGKGWGVSNVVSTTIPVIGKSSDPMRVQDVQISNSGEVYSLIEDVGTI